MKNNFTKKFTTTVEYKDFTYIMFNKTQKTINPHLKDVVVKYDRNAERYELYISDSFIKYFYTLEEAELFVDNNVPRSEKKYRIYLYEKDGEKFKEMVEAGTFMDYIAIKDKVESRSGFIGWFKDLRLTWTDMEKWVT